MNSQMKKMIDNLRLKGIKAVPSEWLKRYLEKSKADFFMANNLVVCEKGFASYLLTHDAVFIVDCYGDGMFWKKFFIKFGYELGKKRIIFATRRNPKAFERRFGVRVIDYDEEDKSWLLEFRLKKKSKKNVPPSELLKKKKKQVKKKEVVK